MPLVIGKCLFRSFASFKIELFVFYYCYSRIIFVIIYCKINQLPLVIGLFRVTQVQEFMIIVTQEGLRFILTVQINSMKTILGKYLTYLRKEASSI